MRENKYLLNTVLTAVLGIALLTCTVIRTFAPAVIIPALDIPNMTVISLAALLIDHYAAPNAKRCYICIPLLSAVSFGLLPFAACFVGIYDALWLALKGGIVFTVTTVLFTSIQERLSSGPSYKLSPILSAVGIYLAAQCFMGMF